MRQKPTPWFVNGEKPVRPGVYNVSCQKRDQSGGWWSLFDGRQWSSPWRLSADRVATMGKKFVDRAPASWRGLAEKPK